LNARDVEDVDGGEVQDYGSEDGQIIVLVGFFA
jgi:hypothetical protein